MSDVIPINPSAVADDLATAATPATAADNPDAYLADIARDVALETLETMQLEAGGVTIEATENTVRVLLLAAAYLRNDVEVFSQPQAVSSMLMQTMDEALDAYAEPIIDAGNAAAEALSVRIVPVAEARARMRAACFAAFRPNPEPLEPTAA